MESNRKKRGRNVTPENTAICRTAEGCLPDLEHRSGISTFHQRSQRMDGLEAQHHQEGNVFWAFLTHNVLPFFTVSPNQHFPDLGAIAVAGAATIGGWLYATAFTAFAQIYGFVRAVINWFLQTPAIHVADIENGDIVPPKFLSLKWIDENVLSITENGRRFPEVPIVFSLMYCLVFGVLTLHSIARDDGFPISTHPKEIIVAGYVLITVFGLYGLIILPPRNSRLTAILGILLIISLCTLLANLSVLLVIGPNGI